MKLKCIIEEYYDRELGKYIIKGDEIAVGKEDRANHLMYLGLVEKVPKDNNDKENKSNKAGANK